MLTLAKLVAGAAIALGILSPSFTPRADSANARPGQNAAVQVVPACGLLPMQSERLKYMV